MSENRIIILDKSLGMASHQALPLSSDSSAALRSNVVAPRDNETDASSVSKPTLTPEVEKHVTENIIPWILATVASLVTFFNERAIGEWNVAGLNLRALLATIAVELVSLCKAATAQNPASRVFGIHILHQLEVLGFIAILDQCNVLVTRFADAPFAFFTIGKPISHLNKVPKEEFDPRFFLHFAELNTPVDDVKLFTLIKGLRLYVSMLYKYCFNSFSYSDRHNPSNYTYRDGDRRVSTSDGVEYATAIKDIYRDVFTYTDTLTEFKKMFGDASALCKDHKTEHKASISFREARKAVPMVLPERKPELTFAQRREQMEMRLAKHREEMNRVPAPKTAPKQDPTVWDVRKLEQALVASAELERQQQAEIDAAFSETASQAGSDAPSHAEETDGFQEVTHKRERKPKPVAPAHPSPRPQQRNPRSRSAVAARFVTRAGQPA